MVDKLFRGKEWTGQYSTDFAKILPGMADDTNDNNTDDHTEEEEMRFSLISGTMKVNHKSNTFNTAKEKQEPGSQQITVANTDRDLTLLAEISPATAYLHTRSYQGLEPQIGETPVQLAQEGISGIPKGYQQELKYPSNTNT